VRQKYDETMKMESDARFENISTRPEWKVVIVHEFGAESMEVVYIWDHVHHDGASGRIFHEQLLRHLKEFAHAGSSPIELTENQTEWVLDLPDPTETLPPKRELLTSWPMSPTLILSELWKGFEPESLFLPGDKHAHWAPICALPDKTSFRTFTLDAHIVTNLVHACRSHQTTITGLIQAL
jgi:hypothetical protein